MTNPRVFIVEDEAIVAADLADRLEAMGFSVAGQADTGARALRDIPAARPDAVLMDIVLKGPIDGIETSRRLRAVCQVPVVYLTSHADERTLRDAVGTDPYGYVLKPFNDRELQVALRIALERHGTEMRLRRLERWLSTILASIGDGVVATDAEGRITLLNAAAQRLTGWADDEAIGRRFDEVLRLVDPASAAPLGDLVEQARSGSLEPGAASPVLLARRDGRLVQIDDSIAPLRDGAGRSTGVVVVFRDAGARLAAEALERQKLAAELASEQKSVFLSRVSHELRNPLNAILGFTELLRTDRASPLDAGQRRRVELMHAAGQHLLALIDDVLDLSRIEQGARPLQIRALLAEPVLTRIMSLLGPDAEHSGIAITCAEIPAGCHVAADPRALEQVLLNLVSNAIKYNRPAGRVVLDVCRTGDHVEIGVTDEGMGLEPGQLAQLFQPFNRLGADQSNISGTGLGLAIAKSLVEAMGGRLTASSTRGQGTRFALTLPAAEAESATAAPLVLPKPVASAALTPPATLLYVEDDAVNGLLFSEALSSTPQWRVVLASDGNQGLALARRLMPDLIVTDINMPGMDGIEFFRALQSDPATRRLRVIALSADAMPEQVRVGLTVGFADYWIKPIDLSTLAERLRRWLPASDR